MKTDNKQIARAVFFSLLKDKEFEAASRLAAAMFQCKNVYIELPIDELIERELKAFGCSITVKRDEEIPSFSIRGYTNIEPVVWFGRCRSIYTYFE